ncbi:MAG: hypothetical protein M3312_05270 [Actinomycetota bacterium]|nr:hypothetical protein [Actinomycetota bacterium]
MSVFRRKERTESRGEAGRDGGQTDTFLPRRSRRPFVESLFVRLIATGGIVGVGTAIAAILGSQDVAAWILGVVVAGLTVILAGLLWSSRTL